MKLQSKLLVSLSERADHVVLRRELAQLGSKSQLSEVIKRLIVAGRLVRLSSGIYAKTIIDSQAGPQLSASTDVLAGEILTKTGRTVEVRQAESDATGLVVGIKLNGAVLTARAAAVSAEPRRERPSAAFKFPADISQFPVKGVASFVANLAKAHGVVHSRTPLDDFAEAVTRLAGDDEQLDSTGKLLAALRKKSVINGSSLLGS